MRELTQTGETIHVVHDPDGNRIAEYDYDDTTGTSTLIRQYIWMEDRPVAVVEGGQIYFIRTDHIGRPVFATNDLGVKVWEASYLPFGGVHVATGGIDLRFPGQWFQAESGLHQNWMRDYDPTTGRYLEPDPLGLVDGASVYGYARQNPGRYVDPRGEQGLEGLLSTPVGRGAMSIAAGAAAADGPAPIGDVIGLCIVGAAILYCSADEQNCTPDDDRCEELLKVDTDTCNGITRFRGKRAGTVCHASAMERYAACRAEKPIPPLNTWNN
ncbi:RHS repeat domain-containing protein [Albidovulum sp.]|uniref:RHS repeat domain-containing protein n=1 Tax=Albidovulum sp. TaxID=1872424 RepID=UPI003038922E